MAFPGSNYPIEAGLRLLLSPPCSNIIVRTACCSVGVVIPVYNTFKAIEKKDPDEQQKCLVYWAAFGTFTVAEMMTDKLIYWFPFYYHMKFAFLVWLQLPSTNGAEQLYMNHLRPFLLRHQARLDYIVGLLYGEMTKFVTVHQAELQFVKKILAGVAETANQLVMGILHLDTENPEVVVMLRLKCVPAETEKMEKMLKELAEKQLDIEGQVFMMRQALSSFVLATEKRHEAVMASLREFKVPEGTPPKKAADTNSDGP